MSSQLCIKAHPRWSVRADCQPLAVTTVSPTDFLLSELLAARLARSRRKDTEMATPPGPALQPAPYSVSGNLSAILKVYGFSQPPAHITVRQIFDKIILKVGWVGGSQCLCT